MSKVSKLFVALNLVHKRMEVMESIPIPNPTAGRDIKECRYYYLACKERELIRALKDESQRQVESWVSDNQEKKDAA